MKEKTFEELVKEEIIDKDNWLTIKEADLIIDLLQQVREATKKEDAEIADKYKAPHIAEAILNTATDRIKTGL